MSDNERIRIQLQNEMAGCRSALFAYAVVGLCLMGIAIICLI